MVSRSGCCSADTVKELSQTAVIPLGDFHPLRGDASKAKIGLLANKPPRPGVGYKV